MSAIKGSSYLKSSLQAIPLVSGKLSHRQNRVVQQQKESAPTVAADSNKANQSWYKNPKVIGGAIATVGTLIAAFAAYKGLIPFPWSATPLTSARTDMYSQSRGVFGQEMSYPSDKPTITTPTPVSPGSREALEQLKAKRNQIYNI